MFEVGRSKGKVWLHFVLDRAVTSPLLRWTWNESSDPFFARSLDEFRPADIDSVPEMVAGRYLLAAKLVDTDGTSPFAAKISHPGWRAELHGFSWLRHFVDVTDEGHRRFARVLVLDWIARYGRFDAESWQIGLTACRVMNWLRHLPLILDGASPVQARAIRRALARQIRSLKRRAPLVDNPADTLMAYVAVLAASICQERGDGVIAARLTMLESELARQIDVDGLHKSRSTAIQLQILTELVTVRQALAKLPSAPSGTLGATISRMHTALGTLTLGTGELGYFNGTGQQQVDLVYALQAQGNSQTPGQGTLSGYAILRYGSAVVIADSGRVPEPEFARRAHAGALSFEFSHRSELLIGNCGPAPAELAAQNRLFRQGAAHSAPTIGHQSSARIPTRGTDADHLLSHVKAAPIEIDTTEGTMKLVSNDYAARYGVKAERWLTLLAAGDTLVGQDRFTSTNGPVGTEPVTLRFHLGPGVKATREKGTDIIHLALPSGARWSFLWEGADASFDESVRQSIYFGFYKTTQIVIETELKDGLEIAWILTRLA